MTSNGVKFALEVFRQKCRAVMQRRQPINVFIGYRPKLMFPRNFTSFNLPASDIRMSISYRNIK